MLRPFDPWRSALCTCPPKYSLSPYTGCDHRCLYCYITAYIPHAFRCRPKRDFIKRLLRDLRRARLDWPVSISSSSDPYTGLEGEMGLTRVALRALLRRGFRVLLVTKSDLVVRDLDLIRRGNCSVSMTVTTLDARIASRLEPGAPSPERRARAIRKLTAGGVPCSARIDPIIPGVNDRDLDRVVRALADAGVKHLVSSTFKAKADSLARVTSAFPGLREELVRLYRHGGGVRSGGAWYLPVKLRMEILKAVREAAEAFGVTFAVCREGLERLNAAETCDGTHLIPSRPGRNL